MLYLDLLYSKAGYNEPKAVLITQHLWIIKENLGGQLYLMNGSDGFHLSIKYWLNTEQLIFWSNITCTWKTYFDDFVIFNPSKKLWSVAIASKHPLQSALLVSLSCLLLMLLTASFKIIFVNFISAVVNLLLKV